MLLLQLLPLAPPSLRAAPSPWLVVLHERCCETSSPSSLAAAESPLRGAVQPGVERPELGFPPRCPAAVRLGAQGEARLDALDLAVDTLLVGTGVLLSNELMLLLV